MRVLIIAEEWRLLLRNVKDYGAIGNGETLDTKAIQKAIDLSGMVYIPEGIYISHRNALFKKQWQ